MKLLWGRFRDGLVELEPRGGLLLPAPLMLIPTLLLDAMLPDQLLSFVRVSLNWYVEIPSCTPICRPVIVLTC